jgi:hypothetical protein
MEAIMWKSLLDWWQATGDLVWLSGLDDRLLADMGLEREGLRQRVLGQTEPDAAPRPAVRRTVITACR